MNALLKQVYPPLLPAFVCLCAGILLAVYFPDLHPWQMVMSALGISAWVFLLTRSISEGIGTVLVCLWGMAVMSGIMTPDHNSPGHYADGSVYAFDGRVDSFARVYPHKIRYVISLDKLIREKSRESLPVRGRIYLSVYHENSPSLLYGTRVQFTAGLRSVRNFSNPGGFDYVRHLMFKGITAAAWTRAASIRVVPEGETAWVNLLRTLQGIRQRCHGVVIRHGEFKNRGDPGVGKNTGSGPAAAVLAAMVLGEKTGLTQQLKDRFARAGVSHILSISGLHLSIIAFFSYFIIHNLFRPCHRLIIQGRAHKIAMGLTLVPISFYAVLAGFSPATQRALIMVSVFILAMTMERETDPLNTLCLAGILILVMNPPALFSISFQLSFTAVAAIITGMTWVNTTSFLPVSYIMNRLAASFWVSLFAGAATLPLTAHYFNTASYIQVLSNLVIVPVMGVICLPLGLAAMGSVFLYLPLARGLLNLVFDILSLCLKLIEVLADCPFAWSRTITPTWMEIALYYLAFCGIFAILFCRKRMGLVLVGAALAGGLGSAGVAVKNRFYPGVLSITALDVGQGASALVQTPEGQIFLIDCGSDSSGTGFDIGRYVVGPYLWRNRIKTIDLLILSHPQADHMNGLGFIMDNFKVRLWIRNQDKAQGKGLGHLIRIAETKQIPMKYPAGRKMVLTYGRVSLGLLPGRENQSRDLNNNALVVQLGFKDFSMLFPADIEAERELALTSEPEFPIFSQVMLAPHHGSRGASSKIFLDHVNPESVIVSCGYKNRHGFPHSETLNRYKTDHIRVYRTDLHGAVTVKTRGTEFEINTNREH